MGTNSAIEWTDHTFNPWIGCSQVSPGCDHCYAEAWDRRFAVSGQAMRWGVGKARTRTAPSYWRMPLRWNAQAERESRRFRVFCASLADVFDNEVPAEWRMDLLGLIYTTPHLDWLLLTKRIGNATEMMRKAIAGTMGGGGLRPWPWPNVWIGASILNQAEADRDIPKLLATPAAKRFLSMEPLLGPVDLTCIERRAVNDDWTFYDDALTGFRAHKNGGSHGPKLDWVIVGGESGPNARPMHPDWARSLRDQCNAAGVPFFFKQWGEWIPYEHAAQPPFLWSQHGHELDAHALPDFESDDGKAQREWHCEFVDELLARRVGKKAAGRLLDGRTWDEVPT